MASYGLRMSLGLYTLVCIEDLCKKHTPKMTQATQQKTLEQVASDIEDIEDLCVVWHDDVSGRQSLHVEYDTKHSSYEADTYLEQLIMENGFFIEYMRGFRVFRNDSKQ